MWNESSGSMYEQYEKVENAKRHRIIIIIKRTIAVVLIALIIAYLILLLIDYNRANNSKQPLITISSTVKNYDDGMVTTYYSLGYVYRVYNRSIIKDHRLEPFWSEIQADNVIGEVSDPNLPKIITKYDVPENAEKKENVNDVLFFYNSDTLLGTYKCLYTGCEISYSMVLPDDNEITPIKMGIIDNDDVFISEYENKGLDNEIKHIYLYSINSKKYLKEYQGIRYCDVSNGVGITDFTKYIAKLNDLWGIDTIVGTRITNYLDFKYDYIKHQIATNYYILKNNEGWALLNTSDKTISSKISDKIDVVYNLSGGLYMLNVVTTDNIKYSYRLFDKDGNKTLELTDISYLDVFEKYIIYVSNNIVYVVDFNGKSLIANPIKLYLTYTRSESGIQAFYANEINNNLVISTPKTNTATHYTDEYYYNLDDFSLIKTRLNVKETLQ